MMPSVNSAGRLAGCFVTPLVACCGEEEGGTGHQTPLLGFLFPCPATALSNCRFKTQTWVQGYRTEESTSLSEWLPQAQPMALPLGWLISGEIRRKGVRNGRKRRDGSCGCCEPGPGARDAGAGALPGLARQAPGPESVWEHECQSSAVKWQGPAAAGVGQRCCTHLSALRGAALLMRQELQLSVGRREQTVCTCCLCSGEEWEAFSERCLFSLSGNAGGVFSGRVCGEGGCSYLLLVPLECQESSHIPVICWGSLSTAPGLPLSISVLASPYPLKRNGMEIQKLPQVHASS